MVSVRSWAMACDVRSNTHFYAPKKLVAQRPLGSNFESSELLESRLAHCYLLEVPIVFSNIMCHGRCKHWSVPSFRRAFFSVLFFSCLLFFVDVTGDLLASFTPKQFRSTQVFSCELYAQAMRIYLRALRPGYAICLRALRPGYAEHFC
jgi:hypothetical protein